jgi:hypothetical protein
MPPFPIPPAEPGRAPPPDELPEPAVAVLPEPEAVPPLPNEKPPDPPSAPESEPPPPTSTVERAGAFCSSLLPHATSGMPMTMTRLLAISCMFRTQLLLPST